MDEKPTQLPFSVAMNASEQPRKFRIFEAGALRFGVSERDISTVAEWRKPTPLPQAPESVLGVVSLEGRMLTVIDLALLAGSPAPSDGYRHILALRGDEQLAIAVTSGGATVEFVDLDFSAATEDDEKFVLGRVQHEGAEIITLNPAELFFCAFRGRERRRRRF